MTTIFGEKVLRYDKHPTDSSESVLNNENDLLNSFVNLNGQADPSRIRPDQAYSLMEHYQDPGSTK